MSRWPPEITTVEVNADGSITVDWSIDQFLNGEEPDFVTVHLEAFSKELPGNAVSYTFTNADEAAAHPNPPQVVIQIDYGWHDDVVSPYVTSAVVPWPLNQARPVQVNNSVPTPDLALGNIGPKRL